MSDHDGMGCHEQCKSVPDSASAHQTGRRNHQHNNFGGLQNTIGSFLKAGGDIHYYSYDQVLRETAETEQLRTAGLQSLSFRHIDARRHDISYPHPGTCDWLFYTEEFQYWRDNATQGTHNGVLWIKGHPGTGKSTLMKHTLAYCQDFFARHSVAAYFFTARGHHLEKTCLGMLRSLACQLVEQDESICDHMIQIFRKKQQRHGKEAWDWSHRELQDIFRQFLCQKPANPLLLLIDALDECCQPHVRDIVQFLEELSDTASKTNVILRICLSSRHFPTVSMKAYQELNIDSKQEHCQDITRYVREKMILKDGVIKESICRKASGIFMWAVLVVNILNHASLDGRSEAMHEKLMELPNDLEVLFESILCDDIPYKDEAVLTLQLVLLAKRCLSPQELYFAVQAGTSEEKVEAWDRSKVSFEQIRRRITTISRGLVEIRPNGVDLELSTVQFIHTSVNDFLLRNRRLQRLDKTLEMDPLGMSHERVRDCCLKCITQNMSTPPRYLLQSQTFSAKHPFLHYAAKQVLYHAEEAEARNINQAKFLHQLREEFNALKWLRYFNPFWKRYPDSAADGGALLLITSAAKGLTGLVERILELGVGVDVGACSTFGLASQTRPCLKQGQGNNRSKKRGEGRGNTHLPGENEKDMDDKGKVMNGAIIVELSERGDHLDPHSGSLGTALQAAIICGAENTFMQLLEKGADMNVCGGIFGTALQAAVFRLAERIITTLLDKGADVNAEGGIFGTALQAALFRQSEDMVARLLGQGANVNILGGFFGTALQTAALWSTNEVLVELLEKGANVDAQGGPFGTALQAACARGREHVVIKLIENGADVNVQGGFFGTALEAAMANRHDSVVAILLQHGAEKGLQQGHCSLASDCALSKIKKDEADPCQVSLADLQAAAVEGQDKLVRGYLEAGIEMNAQSPPYGTAIQAAALAGQLSVAFRFLVEGAHLSLADSFFHSSHTTILPRTEIMPQRSYFGEARHLAPN